MYAGIHSLGQPVDDEIPLSELGYCVPVAFTLDSAFHVQDFW